ncbi:MAG: zinc ribbon domain-containing protein [Gammaproteobacteria bacterium]
MAMFNSIKMFPIVVDDLEPIANDVMDHFKKQNFDVEAEQTITGGWDISLAKGNMFKAVLGMKTALKVSIEPSQSITTAKAGIGIFGAQAVPSVISMFFLWPVLITQIWGMVKQSSLDDEALECVEASLKAHAPAAFGQRGGLSDSAFCTECGTNIQAGAKFCPQCGAKVTA